MTVPRLWRLADGLETHQILQQLPKMVCAVDSVLNELVRVLVKLSLIPTLQQLQVAGNGPERLLKTMRRNIGQLIQFRVKPSNVPRLPNAFLKSPLPLGHVEVDADPVQTAAMRVGNRDSAAQDGEDLSTGSFHP